MAKVMNLTQDGEAEGVVIEVRGMTLTVGPMEAVTVLDLANQFTGWAAECQEEADRLRALIGHLGEIQYEAISKNWFDAAGGEELQDMLSQLRDMWDQACCEQEQKRDAYDDCWAEIANKLDEQRSAPRRGNSDLV